MEVKYVTACEAAKEPIWLKKFLPDLVLWEWSKFLSHCFDNRVVAQSKDPRNHKKGKYIEKNNYIIRDIVARGDVVVAAKIDNANNLTDPFTKALP